MTRSGKTDQEIIEMEVRSVEVFVLTCTWFLGLSPSFLHAEFEAWKQCLSSQACCLKTATYRYFSHYAYNNDTGIGRAKSNKLFF